MILKSNVNGPVSPVVLCRWTSEVHLLITHRKVFPMTKLFAFLIGGLLATTAFAADPTPAASTPSSQQSKMASCNKDAAGKRGAERKAFMKECLSAKPAADTTGSTASVAQQAHRDQMKTCNAEAKGKKGAERKAFMKECLSGTTNATTAPQTQNDKTKPALQSPKP
jgi:hypothetical protein